MKMLEFLDKDTITVDIKSTKKKDVIEVIKNKVNKKSAKLKFIDKEIAHVLNDFSSHNLMHLGEEFAFSFLTGGLVFGIIFGCIGYLFTYRAVVLYRNKKNDRNSKAKEKRNIL